VAEGCGLDEGVAVKAAVGASVIVPPSDIVPVGDALTCTCGTPSCVGCRAGAGRAGVGETLTMGVSVSAGVGELAGAQALVSVSRNKQAGQKDIFRIVVILLSFVRII